MIASLELNSTRKVERTKWKEESFFFKFQKKKHEKKMENNKGDFNTVEMAKEQKRDRESKRVT